jgi:hypothetical protein
MALPNNLALLLVQYSIIQRPIMDPHSAIFSYRSIEQLAETMGMDVSSEISKQNNLPSTATILTPLNSTSARVRIQKPYNLHQCKKLQVDRLGAPEGKIYGVLSHDPVQLAWGLVVPQWVATKAKLDNAPYVPPHFYVGEPLHRR